MVHHRHRLETIHTGISMADTATTGVTASASRQPRVTSVTSRMATAITSFRVLLFVFVMKSSSFLVADAAVGCIRIAFSWALLYTVSQISKVDVSYMNMQKDYVNMHRYKAFLKVVEVGSFTKAAELLGYTQPALSQMMTSLERELSMKLLYRSRYGIRLTPEGERLYPAVESAVRQYDAMRRSADEISGLETGIVRIGTVSSVSAHWLPQVILAFWEKHPNVQIVLHQGDYSSIQEWIRNGAVDFGFVNPQAVKGLEMMVVKSGAFRAVVPAARPLAAKTAVTLEELAGEPFLLVESGAYGEVEEAFAAAGITPNIRLRVHDDYSLLSMVEQGMGVSVLTELVLHKTNYDVVSLPIQPPIIRTLAVVTKDRRTLPLAARVFIDELMAQRETVL